METDITSLSGIGEKRAEILSSMGIYTIDDLIMYAPNSYMDFTNIRTVKSVNTGELSAFHLVITSPPKRIGTNSGISLVVASAKDDSASVALTWFNQPYMANKYAKGQELFVYGRMDKRRNAQITAPIIYTEYPGIVPRYSLKKGIFQSVMAKCVKSALTELKAKGRISETLPPNLISEYQLMPRERALFALHFPETNADIRAAAARIAFEDMLLFRIAVNLKRATRQTQYAVPCVTDGVKDRLTKALPFELTDCQQKVIAEISADLAKDTPMCRLLQGDVGSGKTVVAAYAMMCAVNSGGQAVMLAPTEILAKQHYKTLCDIVGSEHVTILTGGMTKKQKAAAYEAIKSGEASYTVGTHALLEAGVEFKKLILTVCDEQQRFGVAQRSIMRDTQKKRGVYAIPHTLAMSATPIPRTLAFVLYGDLDISVLNARPKGRLPVKTRIVPQSKRTDMYRYIGEQAKTGRQAFVVCPLIETDDDDFPLGSATEVYEELRALLSVPVGLLHGKMRSKAKEQVISDFRNGNIGVLVSTTVIEVGVDVPNAANMIIECAERFGLSQLHQLRGRVGRGGTGGYCFLLSSYEQENERLDTLCETDDGFEISKRDLALRGPGQLLGNAQHGDSEYKLMAMAADMDTLRLAADAADKLFYAYDNCTQALLNRAKQRWN